jgi:hypothetical protein
MPRKVYKPIFVSAEVKAMLDRLKGNLTYDELLTRLADEHTKVHWVDPKEVIRLALSKEPQLTKDEAFILLEQIVKQESLLRDAHKLIARSGSFLRKGIEESADRMLNEGASPEEVEAILKTFTPRKLHEQAAVLLLRVLSRD